MNDHSTADLWPQMSDKVLVDLVNSTQVAGEIVRVKSTRTGLLARAKAALTGRGATENDLIQTALVEGQMTTIAWLSSIERAQASSDLAIARVANALKSMRTRMEIQNHEIEDRFALIGLKIRKCEEDVAQMRLEFDAQRELEWAIGDAEDLRNLSPLAKAFYAVDRLWWGPFGAFVRRPPPGKEDYAQRFVRAAQQRISKLLADESRIQRSSLVELQTLVRDHATSTGPDVDLVRYLASGGDASLSPVHLLLTKEEQPASLLLQLPRQSSTDRITNRLWSEARWVAERRVDE
jgi:hypothetical protein